MRSAYAWRWVPDARKYARSSFARRLCRSAFRSFGVAARNAQDGISLAQTAEGALNEVSNILGRMRELAMQAANGTLSSEDRTTIDTEFQALDSEIQRISDTTEFNGVSLLQTTGTIAIQVGIDSGATNVININTVATDSGDLGTSALGTTTSAAANTAITAIDTAIDSVNTARGQLGADQNRLQSALTSILNVRENLSAAESRIRDVDVASETADLTRNSILQQAATSVLAQANVQPQLALSLLG